MHSPLLNLEMRMKNKSFLNKFQELKPKVKVQLEVEQKLLPRLKIMGYLMIFLTLIALVFAILSPTESTIGPEIETQDFANLQSSGINIGNEEDLLDLNVKDVLNFYMVSFVFALVGASCFLIGWKKKKTLFGKIELNEE